MAAPPRAFRWAAIAGAIAAFLAMTATPASAHGRGSDATNFRSQVTDAPDLPGVSWEVFGGDELLSVRNSGGRELVVLGYDGEPYLRVGPDGVFENTRSPATYINQDRFRLEPPSDADVDPQAPPRWERVSGSDRHLWHDHRIHWMAPGPAVADPGQEQLVIEWAVPFMVDGDQLAVRGELHWVPGPSVWPWLLLGLLVTAPALAGFRTAPREGSWPGLSRPAAVVLAGLVTLNATHLVDDVLAVPLPTSVILFAASQTALFLAVGLFGAVRGWQARDVAFTALGVGAGAIFIGQGLLYVQALGASQTATVFPEWLARLTIAASLTQILPLGVVAFQGTRALLPADPVPATESEGRHALPRPEHRG